MRNGEPIHFCGGRWMHRDEDCQCPCSFCHIYSDTNPQQSDEQLRAEIARLERAWDEVNAMRLDEKNRADRLSALLGTTGKPMPRSAAAPPRIGGASDLSEGGTR